MSESPAENVMEGMWRVYSVSREEEGHDVVVDVGPEARRGTADAAALERLYCRRDSGLCWCPHQGAPSSSRMRCSG